MQAWPCRYYTEIKDAWISVFQIQQRQVPVFLPTFTLGILQNDSYPGGQVFSAMVQLIDWAAKPWFPSRLLCPFSSPVAPEAQQQHGTGCWTFEGSMYTNVLRLWGKVEKTIEVTQYTQRVIVARRACWGIVDRGRGCVGGTGMGAGVERRLMLQGGWGGVLTLSSTLLPVSYYCLPHLDSGGSQRTHRCWQYTTEKHLLLLNVQL